MDWETIERLITLAGFAVLIFGGVYKLALVLEPLIVKLTQLEAITATLVEKITDHEKDFEGQVEKNSEKHREIWEHNKKQDEKIADHEKRIFSLENSKNGQ